MQKVNDIQKIIRHEQDSNLRRQSPLPDKTAFLSEIRTIAGQLLNHSDIMTYFWTTFYLQFTTNKQIIHKNVAKIILKIITS